MQKMEIKFKDWIVKYREHLIAWSVFITWEIVVIGLSSGVFGHPITYLTHYLIIIILFYNHALLVWPFALSKKRHPLWMIPVFTGIEVATFIVLSYAVDKLLITSGVLNNHTGFTFTVPYMMRTLYRGLYFVCFATGFYYLRTFVDQKKKSIDLEKQNFEEIIKRRIVEEERTQAQNAFLMAQINPHFFFNTLDYLYHNVIELSPKMGEAIEILSAMMRFAIDAESIGNFILLGDEIEHLENLIYLHQLRKPLYINLEISEEVRHISIIPLVILTLAENIFKHGDLSDGGKIAEISIHIKGEQLHIRTHNAVNFEGPSERKGTGLKNVSKRLRNAYGEQLTLHYGVDETNYFSVNLMIPLFLLTNALTFSYPLTSADDDFKI
jgi:two-component system LytT family sensor kinase